MNSSAYENAAAWCDGALDLVEKGRGALVEFNEQNEKAAPVVQAFVAQASANLASLDKGLVRRGGAAMLQAFEQTVFGQLSYEQFAGFGRLKEAAKALGSLPTRFEQPLVTADALLREFDLIAGELRTVRRHAAAPLLFIPKQKRGTQWKIALWTLGILGLAAQFSGSVFVWVLFFGALIYFPSSASWTIVTTGNARRLDLQARDLMKRTVAYMERQLEDAANAATDLCQPMLEIATNVIQTAVQPSDFVLGDCAISPLIDAVTAKGVRPRFASYAATKRMDQAYETSPQYNTVYEGVVRLANQHGLAVDFLPGICGYIAIRDIPSNFLAGGVPTLKQGDFLQVRYNGERENLVQLTLQGIDQGEQPAFYLASVNAELRPLKGCVARFSMADCDVIEVALEAGCDHASVGRALSSTALGASRPGGARFMFVEPGRLAETYRVFGSLNDTPATRLADRLYITNVNELASAVDALRTFVGRTKEAMTRQTDSSRRITERKLEEKNTIILQRAIIVIDRTEEPYWPEKDKRRLSEYCDEILSLAQVGAREGSILLIYLRRPLERPSHDAPFTSDRHIRLRARHNGYLLQGDDRVLYRPLDSAAAVAAECDRWSKEAKKADSTLRQTGAVLDWSDAEVSDSRYGLEVEIGRHGADRPARFVLGREGSHHAICIGRTGSGKTNLFHVIISNLVRRYSPDELELFLLDFKEGVEFAVYADLALPHCRAVAIDADRGFGLSVLAHLRRELNRRANIFKAAGVGITSLERYEEITGKNMPRIVLLIDEFQVLLQGERTPGATIGAAAAALEDLVRRGRSFGLHVILGSQTLAGRELTPATLGQLALRIVLPCSAPDAAMLLGDQQISTQLRAPGDAIIWSAGQGNVSDAHLAKIFAADLADLPELADTSRSHVLADGRIPPAPFVFRGSGQNELADLMPHLRAAKSEARDPTAALFALGAPTAYGERPVGTFESRRARNVLFVHRANETRASFLYSALESLLALQSGSEVIICDLDLSRDLMDKPMAHRLAASFNDRVRIVPPAELEAVVNELAGAQSREVGTRLVLAIAGAGRANLSRSATFAKLLREGAEAGLHVIATCDSVRNTERLIERPLIAEFGMRGLGPAPASDSQRLLDANDAEAIAAEHHYLLLDDSAVGRLTRLQVLTSSLERGQLEEGAAQEVANA